MSKHLHNLLCLGDSYTIGEMVPLFESFPYQTVQLLRKQHVPFHAPEVLAKTGWTSFELADYLIHHQFCEPYDYVTLLIGVNNQYRNLPIADFEEDVSFLLRKAIHLAGGHASHVCMLSIPDWGKTPFAHGKNNQVIATEIDAFNDIVSAQCAHYGVHYQYITDATRAVHGDSSLLAKDGLHYAAPMYAQWAENIAAWIKNTI